MALSPAEALVLLDPNAEQGVQAAKVTFLGLLAEGVLRAEQVKGRITSETRLHIARQPAETPPHVGAVLDAVRHSKTGSVYQVTRRLARDTKQLSTFVPVLVRPRLVQRGLLAERRHQEERKVLFVFRRGVTITTSHPTDSGAREQARLRAMLDNAPAIAAELDRDPPRAAAMAAALGPLIVLVPALLAVLGPLAHAMAPGTQSFVSDSSGEDGGGFAWLDSTMAEMDSSLDSALSDASSDSSDGGSDSGGSDGGGGGE
ncbi:MAG: hypothetical protein NTY94_20660 [Alphaproteobacteria bacterium]|nr:hypothetical protein [Alphaproteobacteria bacterium]